MRNKHNYVHVYIIIICKLIFSPFRTLTVFGYTDDTTQVLVRNQRKYTLDTYAHVLVFITRKYAWCKNLFFGVKLFSPRVLIV